MHVCPVRPRRDCKCLLRLKTGRQRCASTPLFGLVQELMGQYGSAANVFMGAASTAEGVSVDLPAGNNALFAALPEEVSALGVTTALFGRTCTAEMLCAVWPRSAIGESFVLSTCTYANATGHPDSLHVYDKLLLQCLKLLPCAVRHGWRLKGCNEQLCPGAPGASGGAAVPVLAVHHHAGAPARRRRRVRGRQAAGALAQPVAAAAHPACCGCAQARQCAQQLLKPPCCHAWAPACLSSLYSQFKQTARSRPARSSNTFPQCCSDPNQQTSLKPINPGPPCRAAAARVPRQHVPIPGGLPDQPVPAALCGAGRPGEQQRAGALDMRPLTSSACVCIGSLTWLTPSQAVQQTAFSGRLHCGTLYACWAGQFREVVLRR